MVAMPNHRYLFHSSFLLILGLLLSNNAFALALPPNLTSQGGARTRSAVHVKPDPTSFGFRDNDDNTSIERQFIRGRNQKSCMTLRCGSAQNGIDEPKNNNNARRRIVVSPAAAIGNWYMQQLDAHELRTKFLSSAILALVGDVGAQKVGHYIHAKSVGGSSGAAGIGVNALLKLDKRRMMALFIDGLIVTGPLLHYIYEFYEWVLPTQHDNSAVDDGGEQLTAENNTKATTTPPKNNSNFYAALAHVLFDNFVMIIPYIAILMITTGILEGRHLASIPHELKHDLLPAVKVSWKASLLGIAPLQLLSFHFLPMKLRVLAVNLLDVIWVTVISFVTHRNRH